MEIETTYQSMNGHCPCCGNPISLWAVAKPTIVPNRFPCNHCGEKLKYIYPWWYIILLQFVGFFAGVSSAIAGFSIVYLLAPAKISASKNLFFSFSIPVIVIFGIMVCIGLGYCEAKYSKTRYKLAKVKSS